MKRDQIAAHTEQPAPIGDRSSGAARHQEGRRAPPVPLPLAAAKISRPLTPRHRIRRQRLTDRLDAAAHYPVTLVCAGAGWGKTVLTSSWAQTQDAPVAWVTLDEQDNHVAVFWNYVASALRAAGIVPAGSPIAEMHAVPDDDTERIRQLEQGLGQLRTQVVLILDDFQEIDDAGIIRDLVLLLRHPPPMLRLILITRSEPALRLHRLQAAGQLTEIRSADLAFTTVEAADLLARHGLSVSNDDVATLVCRTEGWPAGLRLAAAFLAGSDGVRQIADFAGDLRTVDEFIANEIVAEVPPRLRRFLLLTSICDRVCASLADAITLRGDGQRSLEELEQISDFVVRLGSKPEWYRHHRLLRDALRHRLSLETPRLVPELHRRAARWHAGHHSIREALHHAAAAEDWPYLANLVVTQAAPLILSTHRSTLVKLLGQVPPEELSSSAELLVCAALLLFHAGDYDAIPNHLEGARELSADRTDADRLPVEIALRFLQVSVYRAVGDMPGLVAEATQLLGRVAEVRFAQAPSVMQYRAIALNNKGVGLLWTSRPDYAQRYLWAASTAARAAGVELVEISAVGHLALLEAMSGSMKEAAQLAADALDLAQRHGWLDTFQTVAAHLALVLVCIERGEVAEAERALQYGLRAHRSEPEAAQRLVWLGAEARLALAQGQPTTARILLDQARQQRDLRMRAPALDRWLLLTESEVDLTTGKPERVEARYADLVSDERLTLPERVCRARAAFALHDLQRAESLLAVTSTSTSMSETVATVEARILTALIADARGHGLQAVEGLAGAFTLAEREEIRRPFLAMGGDRLESLLGRQDLLAHRSVPFMADIPRAMMASAPGPRPYPTASLSEREAEVLRYLPTMLTAGEIATELGVSVNTVKAHLRSIYRKLDADRRREAVIRAYEHGLL